MRIGVEDLYDIWEKSISKILDSGVNEDSKRFVYGILLETGKMWKNGEEIKLSGGRVIKRRKSIRTPLVVNFLDRIGIDVDERLLPVSAMMDAIVNAADDSSDFDYSSVPKEEIYKNNVKFGVTWAMLMGHVTNIYREVARDSIIEKNLSSIFDERLLEYSINLSMIPVVERKTYEMILKSENESGEINQSIKNYLYRACDVDIFSSIFLETSCTDESKKSLLYETIRYLRALDILSKDLHDIEYDMEKQDAYTPLVAINRKHGISGVIRHTHKIKDEIINMAIKKIGIHEEIKNAFNEMVSYMFKDFI